MAFTARFTTLLLCLVPGCPALARATVFCEILRELWAFLPLVTRLFLLEVSSGVAVSSRAAIAARCAAMVRDTVSDDPDLAVKPVKLEGNVCSRLVAWAANGINRQIVSHVLKNGRIRQGS